MTRYSVTGTITPNATTPTNTGEPAGTFNDQPYWSWTNDAGTWYLWSRLDRGVRWWYVSESTGSLAAAYWGLRTNSPAGNYVPKSPATGTATVSEAPSGPDSFSFEDVTAATPDEVYVASPPVTLGNVPAGATLSVSASGGTPEYQLNGGAWTSSPGSPVSGDTLAVRIAAPSLMAVQRAVIISLAGLDVTWNVTTRGRFIMLQFHTGGIAVLETPAVVES